MQKLWSSLAPHRIKLAAAAALLAIAAVVFLGRPIFHTPNPLLESPVIALESLHANALYFNGPARIWLLAQRPDLLKETDHSDTSERTRDLAQAVINPKLFWQLDRQYHFDALLLTGDPSQYRPLLDHLLATKVWTLRYADHTSLVFRRDSGKPWQLADLDPIRARFASAPAHDRAIFLAQTGARLVAAAQLEAAKQVLDEALQLDDHIPDAWSGLAAYDMAKTEWREALADADHALRLDADFLPAIATKTQLLYGSRHYDEAYQLSQKLISKIPDDPNLLFYHAKIAHEAHAYKAEIAVLMKLIAKAEAENQPLSGYQIYLGQAYGKIGDAQRSINQFMLALNDPELSDDQRTFARDNIARIKKQTGL